MSFGRGQAHWTSPIRRSLNWPSPRRSDTGVVDSRDPSGNNISAMTDSIRIGLVQMTCSERPEENLKKAVDRIAEAAKKGAHIIWLQELFRSRYYCQKEDPALFELAEPIPGPTTEALSPLARKLGIVIVAS